MEDDQKPRLKELIASDSKFFDSAIDSHGFAPFLRDYDVVIDVPALRPDGMGSWIMGRFRYRFTHCPEAHATTTVGSETWQESWDDHFTDYQQWEEAGEPSGYVWGVNYANAYPGMTYVDLSPRASVWTERFKREMHEVRIESNALVLEIVCHDLRVKQLAVADPESGELRDIAE